MVSGWLTHFAAPPTAASPRRVVQHDHRPAGGPGVVLVMSHEKNRETAFARMIEGEAAKILAQSSVQLAERLVEEKRSRGREQGPHQGDARLLPARKSCRVAAREAIETSIGQGLIDLSAASRAGRIGDSQTKGQVLADREMRKQEIVLKQDADAPLLRPQLRDRFAPDQHRSLRRECAIEKAADIAQKSRFPGAARAHDRHDLTGFDDAVERWN